MSLLLGLQLAILLYIGLPILYTRSLQRRLQTICRQHQLICLTFDDGPGAHMTRECLLRLEARGVRGSFFVLTQVAHDKGQVLRETVARRHEVFSHGHAHVNHIRSWPWRGIRDTRRAAEELPVLVGSAHGRIPFRPPYGKLNLFSLLFCMLRGIPVAMWTHDSYDTWRNADLPPRMLADTLRRSGGGVVLLHDFDRSTQESADVGLAKLEAVLDLHREG